MLNNLRNNLLLKLGVAALGTIIAAQAGPPLICHPYNIGGAKSLPWGSGNNWDNPDPAYNIKNLANDTLALLDQNAPVLVRMETLRRAVIYGSLNHDAARALLAQLQGREQSPQAGANAFFDYGYFLSSIKQMDWKYKEDLTGGKDGYEFVQKALALVPDSSEMHFAAAIMASFPARPSERDEHLRKARAAKNDALLAQNLSTHFQ
jgi:hypothetical protein